MYLESGAVGCWVSCEYYKNKRRLVCWVGWQSTTWTVKNRNGSPTCIIQESARDNGSVPPAATWGTTSFSPNLWPFHQHQGDWERAGQSLKKVAHWFLQQCGRHWEVSATSSDPQRKLRRKVTRTEVLSTWYELQLHKHQLYKINIAHELYGNGTGRRVVLYKWLHHTILHVLPSISVTDPGSMGGVTSMGILQQGLCF